MSYEYSRNVIGIYQRCTHTHFTMPSSIIVLRIPVFSKIKFFVIYYSGRRNAVINSCQIDERLESRTRLPFCQHSTVELIGTASANHSFYITSLGVNSNNSNLRLHTFVFVSIIVRQIIQRIVSSFLHFGVYCGIYLETLFVHCIIPIFFNNLLCTVIYKILKRVLFVN